MTIGLNSYEFQLDTTGVRLNTDATGIPFVDITKVTGLDSAPYRETLRDHEGVDGGFIDAEFETGRDLILEGIIYCDTTSVEPFLDNLKANFAPVTSPIPLYLKSTGVAERVIFVKPRGVRFDWETARGIGVTPAQFLMYAEDPRIYDNDLLSIVVPFGGAATTGFGFTTFRDTFSTVASSTWNNTDTGDAYTLTGGSASDYFEDGSSGFQAQNSIATFRHSTINISNPNFNVTAIGLIPIATPGGGSISQSVVGRFTDTSNYYGAGLSVDTSANVKLTLIKRVAGVLTTLVANVTVGSGHLGTDAWNVQFVGYNSFLKCKAWKVGTAKPTAWTCEFTTDTALTTGNNIGLLSRLETGNTDTQPVNISWDNLQVSQGTAFSLDFGPTVPPSGGTVVVTGNRPTPAIMTIQGPVVNPRIINQTDGLTLAFVITLGASDVLSIDLANKTVTLNGVTNSRNTLQEPNWWLFNPGSTFVVFGGVSGSGTLTIAYRNAWR